MHFRAFPAGKYILSPQSILSIIEIWHICTIFSTFKKQRQTVHGSEVIDKMIKPKKQTKKTQPNGQTNKQTENEEKVDSITPIC